MQDEGAVPAGASVPRGYVRGEWGLVHYRAAGDRGPWVVLFHESPLSSAVYDKVLPLLAGSARAVAFDTPGYGLSEPPDRPREIPDYARVLLGAMDRLGIDEFTAVGAHTGASIAVQVALQAGPHRVRSLVLSGVPVYSNDDRARHLQSWAPEASPVADGSHLSWGWARYQRIWGEESDPALLHFGAISLLSNLERYSWAYNAAFRHDPVPDLQRLECPVLLLVAEHDLLVEADRRSVGLLRCGELREVPGLVGQLPMRAPGEFASNILRYASGDGPARASSEDALR